MSIAKGDIQNPNASHGMVALVGNAWDRSIDGGKNGYVMGSVAVGELGRRRRIFRTLMKCMKSS